MRVSHFCVAHPAENLVGLLVAVVGALEEMVSRRLGTQQQDSEE